VANYAIYSASGTNHFVGDMSTAGTLAFTGGTRAVFSAANAAGDQYLSLYSTNAGAGQGLLDIYADDGIALYSINAGLDIDVATTSHWDLRANSAGDQTLRIKCTNAGAGAASIQITADDDITVTSGAGALLVDAPINLLGTATQTICAAENYAETIAGSAVNQVLDALDNVDEGASVYKAGILVYEFFVRGATAATADEVYGGVLRIKFQGASAASAEITPEWTGTISPDITFNTTIAADQIQLLASNSLATDINWYAIRKNFITSQSHV
jgi:hypothetical protein